MIREKGREKRKEEEGREGKREKEKEGGRGRGQQERGKKERKETTLSQSSACWVQGQKGV